MVEVRRALLLLTLAGCNEFYGLEPTTIRDLEPPACATVQFGAPVQLEEFREGVTELDPQLSTDGTELWLVITTLTSGGNRDLLYRTVRGADGKFAMPELLDLVQMNTRSNTDPALTADGLRMMFRVENQPATLFEGLRSHAGQFPFETIVSVNGVGAIDVQSFDLTWDGLRIYVTNRDGELLVGSRPSRDQPFEAFELRGTNMEFPTVSGDELEIFYRHPQDPRLYRSARTSRSESFAGEQVILDIAADPDIAPNSTQLIVGVDQGLAMMKRRCDD